MRQAEIYAQGSAAGTRAGTLPSVP